MIRGVRKLAPGEALVAGHDKIAIARYWDLRFRPDQTASERDWIERIRARVDETVRSRLVSDVPLGCLLSGGIDSTAVTATAARIRAGIRTFTVGYAEGGHDERRFARLVADRYGTRHEELVVSAGDALGLLPDVGALMDEPLADMSFVPLHLLARATKRSVTVALTGDGGDELFGGYPAMAADWWQRRFAALPPPVRRGLIRLGDRVPDSLEGFREFLRGLGYPPDARNQMLIGGAAPEQASRLLSPALAATIPGFDPYGTSTRRSRGVRSRTPAIASSTATVGSTWPARTWRTRIARAWRQASSCARPCWITPSWSSRGRFPPGSSSRVS
jgi:hypothetical protein